MSCTVPLDVLCYSIAPFLDSKSVFRVLAVTCRSVKKRLQNHLIRGIWFYCEDKQWKRLYSCMCKGAMGRVTCVYVHGDTTFYLPSYVDTCHIGDYNNHEIILENPNTLFNLTFGDFGHRWPSLFPHFPQRLKHLVLPVYTKFPPFLPLRECHHLESLVTFYYPKMYLAPTLVSLRLFVHRGVEEFDGFMVDCRFPESLQHLEITCYYHGRPGRRSLQVTQWPPKLKTLCLGYIDRVVITRETGWPPPTLETIVMNGQNPSSSSPSPSNHFPGDQFARTRTHPDGSKCEYTRRHL
jgi:hypothetical protein